MEPILLSLNVSEVNIILNALFKQPYADVNVLVQKITNQANKQLSEEKPTMEIQK